MGSRHVVQSFEDIKNLAGRMPDDVHATWSAAPNEGADLHEHMHMLPRSVIGDVCGNPVVDGVEVALLATSGTRLGTMLKRASL